MFSFSHLHTLVRKEILTEWRQRYVFFGILLYAGSTVFVVYIMNGQPEPRVWNALFWITQLFVAVHAVAKSFLQESRERFRYYYTLAAPATFLLAKMSYSIILLLCLSLLNLLLFSIMLGMPVEQTLLFVFITALGSFSLSVVFTFLSAIAASAQQNSVVMAVLGFPLVTPLLMMLGNLALSTLAPVYQPGFWMLAGMLFLLSVLVVALGVILFPYLWGE